MCKLFCVFSFLLILIVNFDNINGKPQLGSSLGCGGLWGNTYSYPWNNCLYSSNPYYFNYGNPCCSILPGKKEVKVTVYYETMCPDSNNFFNLLNATYKNLGSNFNLHLVPYGKAEHTPKYPIGMTIRCHHGDTECIGNKIHGCLLTKPGIPDVNKFDFLICTMNGWSMMRTTDTENEVNSIAKDCASKHSIDFNYINECLKVIGDQILLPYIYETEILKRVVTKSDWVPTIVFNDIYKDSDQKARTNFQEVLCSYLGSDTKGC